MSIINFNFPTIDLNLNGIAQPTETQIKYNTSSSNTNIQYNSNNFTATTFYFTNNSGTNYFVVKCHDDPIDISKSSYIYFVFPLELSNTDEKTSETDIDNIIKSTGTKVVSLTLNTIISSNRLRSVNIYTSTPTSSSKVVVTLVTNPIKIATKATEFPRVYDVNNILKITLSGTSVSALIHRQDLDWQMDCELLTEDDNSTTNIPNLNNQDTTATTITLLSMIIIIACVGYISAPVIYQLDLSTNPSKDNVRSICKFVENHFKLSSGKPNHYAINVYFGLFFVFMGAILFINGIVTNTKIYHFFAISVVLFYFSSTSSIVKSHDIGNPDKNQFINTDSPIMVFTKYYDSLWHFKDSDDWLSYGGFFIVGFCVTLVSVILMLTGIGKKMNEFFFAGIALYVLSPVIILYRASLGEYIPPS